MNNLISKRLFRILLPMLVLILGLNIAGMNGYWIDTRVIATNVGFPEFLGSIWFNLLTLVFTAVAIQILSTREQNDTPSIKELGLAICIFVSLLSPFIGLFIPLTIITVIMVAVIIIVICLSGIIWISEFRAVGKIKKRSYAWKHKILDFFWN